MTVSAPRSQPWKGPVRLLDWADHRSIWLSVSAAAVFVVLPVLPGQSAHAPSLLLTSLIILCILMIVIARVLIMRHRDRLCEPCIAEAPVDPQKAVDRHRKWLLFDHRLNIPALLVYLAGILLTSFLMAGWASMFTRAATTVPYLCFLIADRLHSRLQPWCPWCNWGDGDDDDVIVEPSPVPVDHAPSPA